MKHRFMLVTVLALILAACGGTTAPGGEGQAQPTAGQSTDAQTQPTQAQAPAGDATAAPAGQASTGGTEFHGAWPYQMPPTGHLNSFVTNFMGFGIYEDMLETPLAMYSWADGEFIPYMATEWNSEEGDYFTVKLREGVTWSDGSTFSSEDVLTTFYLERVMNTVVWKYIDSVEAPDATTVRFHFSNPTSVAPRFILKTRISAHSIYGDLSAKAAELMDEPADSEANKALREELTNFRPTEYVSSGPVKLDQSSITSSRLTLVKNPGGFASDKLAFDSIVLYAGETPDITPVVLSKEADYATHGFPTATENSFTENGIRVIRPPTVSGPAIFFNYTNPHLAKPEVRQAMAYAVNREENGAVSLGQSGRAVQYMTGFSDSLVSEWLGEADVAKLNTYAYDPAKAEELLTAAGYTKGGDGVWAGPDGRLEFELTAPAEFADWSAAAENLATQLTAFGIATTFRGVQFQQHLQDVQQGNFTIAIRAWGAGNPHPFFSYEADLLTFNQPISPGPGMSFPFEQTVGGETVDLNELITATAVGLDVESQKPAVTEMALTFNQLLPIVPLWERYGNNAALEGVRVAEYPADDDPIWQNALYADNPVVILLMDGRLKPA